MKCTFNTSKNQQQGFTLVEVLISIAILVIITSVILVQSASSRGGLVLTNDAYEVALMVRETQSFGVSVREGEAGGDFDVGYGVFVQDPTRVIMYNDIDKDAAYDSGSDPIVREVNLQRGNTITNFCLSNGGSQTCSGAISGISIAFIRPNPDAYISDNNGTFYQDAEITISSPYGDTKRVTAYTTGQISVDI